MLSIILINLYRQRRQECFFKVKNMEIIIIIIVIIIIIIIIITTAIN